MSASNKVFRNAQLVAAALCVLSIPTSVQAKKKEHVVYSFSGGSDGTSPYAGLIVDTAGNFYGTTRNGGASSSCSGGCGTVFELTPDGHETVLHAFGAGDDGANPYAALIEDAKGNLYGTTQAGGTCNCGTVFEISRTGKEAVLHAFAGFANSDGYAPMGSLVVDKQGNLYGTTSQAGAICCGAVFKIDRAGNESLLYSFEDGADGASPMGSLIIDHEGNLYGTTSSGGSGSCNCGTVFEIRPDGSEITLHTFDGSNGANPHGSLLADGKGNFYGTTAAGGGSCNCGTVFKLSAAGHESTLYTFLGSPDGASPLSDLVMDKKGTLYGTTQFGGTSNEGTVFNITKRGTEAVSYSFGAAGDGAYPSAALAGDAKGTFYGTTTVGGANGDGTVFSLRK